MLTFSKKDDQCDITYVSEVTGRELVYSFSPEFLPATTLRHVNALGLFLQSNVTYILNAADDHVIVAVLDKLVGEKQADYIFSDQLQKTYLIEFIHLLTKMHLRKTV